MLSVCGTCGVSVFRAAVQAARSTDEGTSADDMKTHLATLLLLIALGMYVLKASVLRRHRQQQCSAARPVSAAALASMRHEVALPKQQCKYQQRKLE
jgi:hypothetical protein